jgi:hypothetical protein
VGGLTAYVLTTAGGVNLLDGGGQHVLYDGSMGAVSNVTAAGVSPTVWVQAGGSLFVNDGTDSSAWHQMSTPNGSAVIDVSSQGAGGGILALTADNTLFEFYSGDWVQYGNSGAVA